MEQQNKKPTTKTTFSGFLNQHEFSQRLHFIRSRMANQYSLEETAFLLGRTTHYIQDFEELGPIKMDWEDTINYSYLFTDRIDILDRFDTVKNDINISFERRAIRGCKLSSQNEIKYEFTHPWMYEGFCKPVVILETTKMPVDETVEGHVKKLLVSLIASRYFAELRPPIEIYKEIVNMSMLGAEMILPLRNVLYRMVRNEQLKLRQHFDKFSFMICKATKNKKI